MARHSFVVVFALLLVAAAAQSPFTVRQHGLPLYPGVKSGNEFDDGPRRVAELWTPDEAVAVESWYRSHLAGWRAVAVEQTSAPRITPRFDAILAKIFGSDSAGDERSAIIYRPLTTIEIAAQTNAPSVGRNGTFTLYSDRPVTSVPIPSDIVQRLSYPRAHPAQLRRCSAPCAGYATTDSFENTVQWYRRHLSPDSDRGQIWDQPKVAVHQYFTVADPDRRLRYNIRIRGGGSGTHIILIYERAKASVGAAFASVADAPAQRSVANCVQTAPGLTAGMYPGATWAFDSVNSADATAEIGFVTADSFEAVRRWYAGRFRAAAPGPLDKPGETRLTDGMREVRLRRPYTAITLTYRVRPTTADGIVLTEPGGSYTPGEAVAAGALPVPKYPAPKIGQPTRGRWDDDPPEAFDISAAAETHDSVSRVEAWYRSHMPSGSYQGATWGDNERDIKFSVGVPDLAEQKTVEIRALTSTQIVLKVHCTGWGRQ